MLELAASSPLEVNSVCLLLLSMEVTHSSQSNLSRDTNNLRRTALPVPKRINSQPTVATRLQLLDKLPLQPLVLEESLKVWPTCRSVGSSVSKRKVRLKLLASKDP